MRRPTAESMQRSRSTDVPDERELTAERVRRARGAWMGSVRTLAFIGALAVAMGLVANPAGRRVAALPGEPSEPLGG